MGMHVTVRIMSGVLTAMTMDVKMKLAVSVPVAMEMNAGTPQAKKYLSSQQDQHHSDNALQRMCQVVTEAQIQKDGSPGKDQQGQRMA